MRLRQRVLNDTDFRNYNQREGDYNFTGFYSMG
jgi:hypothetical protein